MTQQTWPNPATFWRNKRVIVSGGSGFLGSVVVRKLRERGVQEIIVPRSKEYDLRNVDAIRQLLGDAGCEVRGAEDGIGNHHSTLRTPHAAVDMVIHLAARVGGIGSNRAYPAEFFYDNLMMGASLFHESWRAGIAKFVALGTICAYPKYTPLPFKEENLWDGYPEETNAPYGLAKKMLLVQSQSYREQYGYNSIFLLPVNLYGPGDNFDLETSHVIPGLIRKILTAAARGDQQMVAWGDGTPTREFLYVDDAAEGILLAAERYNQSDPVNLGSSYEISIKDLWTMIARLTGFTGEVVWDTSKPNGQPRRKLDVTRAKERFGFVSATNFEQGLSDTIQWYQRQSTGEGIT